MTYLNNRQITKYVLDYGFIMHLKGTSYFISAVNEYINGEFTLQKIYYKLALQNHTEPQNIERCIRYFIRESFKNKSVKRLFPYFRTAPPIKEVISVVSEKIKLNA